MASIPPLPSPSQLWPIINKGKPPRRIFSGPPQLEAKWHKAMEEGRHIESSVNDAMFACQKEKADLQRAIQHYVDLNQVANDAKPRRRTRVYLLSADIRRNIGKIHVFMTQISALQQALQKNLAQLQSILQMAQAMVQRNQNALANFMKVVCNLGLPPLPSIPAFFGANIFTFNGFSPASLLARVSPAANAAALALNSAATPEAAKAASAALDAAVSAAGNLSGGTKTPPLPNVSVAAFTNFSFSQCSPMKMPAVANTAALAAPPVVVPLDGVTVGAVAGNFVPPLAGAIGDPAQLTDPAYILQLQGNTTVPIYDPATVNPATLLKGSLPNPVFIISDFQMPSTTYKANVLSTLPVFQNLIAVQFTGLAPISITGTAEATPIVNQERALLIEYVNLDGIVASNYDKNLTATWLYYLEAARLGRGGAWLPNFEAAYQTYIQPSLVVLDDPQTAIPWNTVLGGDGTVDAPDNIPLIDTLVGSNVASPAFIVFGGTGTIESAPPVTAQNILWKLSYIEASLLGYSRTLQFDAAADAAYLSTFTGADLDYATTTYDAADTVAIVLGADTADFPVSCTVPKTMLNALNAVIVLAAANIADDPAYVTNRPQFRFTYDAFAQAVQVDRFSQFWRTFNYNFQQLLAQDPYVVSRVVSYAASLDSAIDPLANVVDFLQIQDDALARSRSWSPGQPLLTLPVPPIVEIGPLPGLSGTATGWSGSDFDPQAFLDRPDIQSLPLSVQLTMLRTNESYAALMSTASDIQATVDAAIAQAQAALASIQNNGFDVFSSGPLKVKSGISPLPVAFDQIGYDNTNFATSPTLFTVQVTGTYMLSGSVTWDKGPAGIRTAMLMQNSTIVLDEESTNILSVGPITQNFSIVQQLSAGDTLQVLVAQATGKMTTILLGAEFTALLVPSTDTAPVPVDTDINAPAADDQTRSLAADATMVAGTAVAIQPDGGVLPVDPVGAVGTPFVDGIVVDPVQQTQLANVGTSYGNLYTIAGAAFAVGGLIFVGPFGVLTQDYSTLITSVNWIIVAGRAISPSMMLFEPQIPTKTVLMI